MNFLLCIREHRQKAWACVFDQSSTCPHDLVLGLDLLVPLGICISCLTQTIAWSDGSAPWNPKSNFDGSHLLADLVSCETHCFFVDADDDFDEWIESHQTSADVKSSKHEKVDTDCAAAQQTHLTPSQQAEPAGQGSKRFCESFQLQTWLSSRSSAGSS